MFKFTHNGWKLNYLASMSYPAWQKTNLDNNGRWKLRKGKGLKVEDNNNNNNNNSTDEISKKQKSSHHACKLEELEKKFKESYQGKDNIPQSSSLSSLSPPPSNSSALLGSVQLSPKLSSKDFPPTMQEIYPPPSVNISSGSTAMTRMQLGASPILELADTILPAMMSTIPTVPEDNPAVLVSKLTKGSGKAKMHPGPTKNGWYVEDSAHIYHSFLPRNLCTHHWCKQIQLSGCTEEFQRYYNGLTAEQRKIKANHSFHSQRC
ncbi:hypothetical protein V8B97DRAFT_2020918 [Scleroderma yunnanense]